MLRPEPPEDDEEVIVIDEDGRVAGRQSGGKPVILRDSEGEY